MTERGLPAPVAALLRQAEQVLDRVALHMHNVVEAALTYLACLRLGAVAMPLNTRLAPRSCRI